jgi:hypothetical protein
LQTVPGSAHLCKTTQIAATRQNTLVIVGQRLKKKCRIGLPDACPNTIKIVFFGCFFAVDCCFAEACKKFMIRNLATLSAIYNLTPTFKVHVVRAQTLWYGAPVVGRKGKNGGREEGRKAAEAKQMSSDN